MKLHYNREHCVNCTIANKMAIRLKELGYKIEINGDNKCPWTEHPILYVGGKRITGDKVVERLAGLGGEKCK